MIEVVVYGYHSSSGIHAGFFQLAFVTASREHHLESAAPRYAVLPVVSFVLGCNLAQLTPTSKIDPVRQAMIYVESMLGEFIKRL